MYNISYGQATAYCRSFSVTSVLTKLVAFPWTSDLVCCVKSNKIVAIKNSYLIKILIF